MAAEENTLERRLGPRLIGFRRLLLPASPYQVTLEIEEDTLHLVFLHGDHLATDLNGCIVTFQAQEDSNHRVEATIQAGRARIDLAALDLDSEAFDQVTFHVTHGQEVLRGTLSG